MGSLFIKIIYSVCLNNMFLCSTDIFLPTPDSLLVNLNECKEVGILFLTCHLVCRIKNRKTQTEAAEWEKTPQSPHSVRDSSSEFLAACAGSAEELTDFISKDHGDPVCTGFSPAGWLQAAVAYRRPHVCLPDTAAEPRCRGPAVKRRPQPKGIC